MEGTEELDANWEDELIRELLDDETPFVVQPKIVATEPVLVPEPAMNSFVSKVYSGPTIEDIRKFLSTTQNSSKSDEHSTSRPSISITEKALSKMEKKYSLKIKSCGNGMGDDGYKWRKYGQKSIKNSPNPRSYYRCTNPRCNAKKQVERSAEDPDTLVVTYEGLHLHFAYSHFLLTRPRDSLATIQTPKRPKTLTLAQEAQPQANDQTPLTPQVGATSSFPITTLGQDERVGVVGAIVSPKGTPQGLLEDVVPLIVRNPINNPIDSNAPCFSSYPSSPTFSWSPNSCSFDIRILSSIR